MWKECDFVGVSVGIGQLIPSETYFIIPKTEQAGVQRSFLLRVMSPFAPFALMMVTIGMAKRRL